MEKEKKEIKISLWTFYVLVAAIVVLVGAVVIGALNVQKQQNNKQNGEMLGNNEQGQQQVADVDKVEQLNVNSELVQKLYGYVGETSDYFSLSMYQTEKTNNKNIPNKTKLLTAIRRALMDNLGKEEKVTNKVELAEYNNEKGLIINGYSEWDRTPEQYTTFADTMTYLDSTVVEKYVKKIFGQDATVTHEDASFIFGEKVMYENGKYKIFQYEGGGGTNWFDLKEIVKAEKKGNEIHIYDNYIRRVDDQAADFEQHMDYGIMKFYASSEQKMKIAELNEKTNQQDFMTIINYYEEIPNINRYASVLNITLPQYKHTFKQAENGEYYWVSTELVNKNELKIVE